MRPALLALPLILVLAACQATMQTEVTHFSAVSPLPVGHSFAVVAENNQIGNLEFQHYAGLVGAALQDHGFLAAPPGTNAELAVLIHYGSAGQHTDIYGDPWGPPYGPWGWRHPYPYWPYGYGGMESQTYYSQMLEVQIFDGAAWRNNVHTMLYQGRAVGDATAKEINIAVPTLVRGLFTHFPGNSGRTEHVAVPIVEENDRSAPVMTTPPLPAQSKPAL